MFWHDKEIKDVLKELNTLENGLTDEEAKNRLEKYGPNEIKEKRKFLR